MNKQLEKQIFKAVIIVDILKYLHLNSKIKVPYQKTISYNNFDKILKDYDAIPSDLLFLNRNGELPNSYYMATVGFDCNWSVDEQCQWIKENIEDIATKSVRSVVTDVLGKAGMDTRVKNLLIKTGLFDLFYKINDEKPMSKHTNFDKTVSFNEVFTNEQFQDLVFITQCETIYNPELELQLDFTEHNRNFWERFKQLYNEVFIKEFGESKIFNDGFFLNDKMKKERDLLGFELLEYVLDSNYPKYPERFSPYLKTVNLITFDEERKQDEDYINFRKNEYRLYSELCNKYNIQPQRLKVM